MDRQELLKRVRDSCPPWGYESKYPKLFGKYGLTVGGMCEKWIWFEEDNLTEYAKNRGCLPLTSATNKELLEMWGLSNYDWLEKYKEWYHRETCKSNKLDWFIGECERNYFGYDKNGYTSEAIDRIFDSIFKILDKHFNKK